MFESLKKFEHIFVTGPQRSGTTICGKMIANDTGHNYIDEFKFGVANLEILRELVKTQKNNVYQCPGVCRFIHEFSADNTAIVLMRRSVADILASQERINWRCEKMELFKYKPDERHGLETISEIKYRFWDTNQRLKIKNAFEVQYDFMSAHPMWIEKERRKTFHAKQTSIEDKGIRPKPKI